MFSPYTELLTQSRVDSLYDFEIPAIALRAQAQERDEQPTLGRAARLWRVGRRALGPLRRQHGIPTAGPAVFD